MSERTAFGVALLLSSMVAPASNAQGADPIEAQLLRADARDELLFVTLSPVGTDAAPSQSSIGELDDLLARDTSLSAKSAEQMGLDPSRLRACEADRRFGCWLDELSNVSEGDAIRFLLVLGAHPIDPENERWTFVFLDVALAKKVARGIGPQAAEEAIYETATLSEPSLVRVSDVRARRDALRTLVVDHIEDRLRKAGSWRPFGEIQLQNVAPGLEIAIDGRLIGLSDGRPIRILDVRPGTRRVTAKAPDGFIAARELGVEAEQTVLFELPEPPDRALARLRRVGLWTGVAVAAAGIATLGAGLALGKSDVRLGCFGSEASVDGCASRSNVSLRTIEETPLVVSDLAGGVSPEAIGAGLTVTGVSWLAGALAAKQKSGFWLQLGLGLALGVATTIAVSSATGG